MPAGLYARDVSGCGKNAIRFPLPDGDGLECLQTRSPASDQRASVVPQAPHVSCVFYNLLPSSGKMIPNRLAWVWINHQ